MRGSQGLQISDGAQVCIFKHIVFLPFVWYMLHVHAQSLAPKLSSKFEWKGETGRLHTAWCHPSWDMTAFWTCMRRNNCHIGYGERKVQRLSPFGWFHLTSATLNCRRCKLRVILLQDADNQIYILIFPKKIEVFDSPKNAQKGLKRGSKEEKMNSKDAQ